MFASDALFILYEYQWTDAKHLALDRCVFVEQSVHYCLMNVALSSCWFQWQGLHWLVFSFLVKLPC